MTDREQWRAQTGCVHPKSAFPRAGPAEGEIGSALKNSYSKRSRFHQDLLALDAASETAQ